VSRYRLPSVWVWWGGQFPARVARGSGRVGSLSGVGIVPEWCGGEGVRAVGEERGAWVVRSPVGVGVCLGVARSRRPGRGGRAGVAYRWSSRGGFGGQRVCGWVGGQGRIVVVDDDRMFGGGRVGVKWRGFNVVRVGVEAGVGSGAHVVGCGQIR
jgi:hypothetical protein